MIFGKTMDYCHVFSFAWLPAFIANEKDAEMTASSFLIRDGHVSGCPPAETLDEIQLGNPHTQNKSAVPQKSRRILGLHGEAEYTTNPKKNAVNRIR